MTKGLPGSAVFQGLLIERAGSGGVFVFVKEKERESDRDRQKRKKENDCVMFHCPLPRSQLLIHRGSAFPSVTGR